MNKFKRIALVLIISIYNLSAFAQPVNIQQEEPADFMRSNGKIYVVMAVVVVIVAGLFFYLLSLDRKITKLEKNSTK